MIKKQPFIRYKLDEEKAKEKDKIIPIRFNLKEQMLLSMIKKLLNVSSDSKAIKIMMVVGHKCIKTTFGERLTKYLFKKNRERLSDYLDC